MRSVPAGLPRKLLRSSSASSISRNAGLIRENSRSPASVSATLRVVRLISRRSSRSSILRSAWLSAEADTPSSVAAARKLRCRAMARKVARSEGSIRIDKFFSAARELFTALAQLWRATIHCPSGSANPPDHNQDGKKMRVWFITGASRGFGALIAEAALKAGDAVVATARDPSTVTARLGSHGRLLATRLDVTSEAEAHEAAGQAVKKFGRIDILVNNAGYGLLGAIDEASATEATKLFGTNVFGLLGVIRAVLPHMRRQRSGHIINVSSVGGYAGFPGWGVYGATKFAVEGISEALAGEVAPLGIRVTVVEPGFFRTDFLDDTSLSRTAQVIDDYHESVGK